MLIIEWNNHKMSKKFFIQKAIGQALKEYVKTNPQKVKNFVSNTNLMHLGTKEALNNMNQAHNNCKLALFKKIECSKNI